MPAGNPSDPGDSVVREAFRTVSRPRRSFRTWLLDNYRLLYLLDLNAAYTSLMLYLASLLCVGRPTLLSKIFFGTLAVTAFIAVMPFLREGSDLEPMFVKSLKTRRSKGVERVEKRLALVLWLFIAAMFLFALSRCSTSSMNVNRKCLARHIFLLLFYVAALLASAQKKPPAKQVDLTSATLEQLPGIGPSTAKAILQFREKSGPYESVEDLLAIYGISRPLEKLRPYIIVRAPAQKSQMKKGALTCAEIHSRFSLSQHSFCWVLAQSYPFRRPRGLRRGRPVTIC